MKSKIIFTATAVLLLCVGIGMFLYASSNNSTTITAFSTEEVADNTETVSSPPEVMCVAYCVRRWNDNTMSYEYKVVTTYPTPEPENPYEPEFPTEPENPYEPEFPTEPELPEWEVIDREEGTVMENFVGGPSLCSAYYILCDRYDVEYEN